MSLISKLLSNIKSNSLIHKLNKPVIFFITLLSLIISTLHFLLFRSNIQNIFTLPEDARLYMHGLKMLSYLFGFFIYFTILTCIYLLYKKNKLFWSYFKYFLIYFCIMGVFWLLTWPGIFKGDEFYVLRSALSFELSPAQTGLTSCFYIICLLFCPTLSSIVFIQLSIICFIFAYIMKNMNDIYNSRKIWILYPFFLLLPIIDGNLFTLRSTLVGWLFLFIIFSIFFCYKKNSFTWLNFFVQTALSGLVCAWRSEYIYLIVFIPAVFLILKLTPFKKAFLGMLVIFVCFNLFQIPNKIAANGSNKYPISLLLNPLANIFTEEHIEGPSVYEDILVINELVDVRRLRLDASVRNISQYWNIPDTLPKEQLNRFIASSMRIIIYNFDDYLKYRLQTFLYTNGIYPNYINHPGGEMISGILELEYYDTNFNDIFPALDPPLGQTLRQKTINFLACRDYIQNESTTTKLLPVFYNSIPAIILLILSTIIAFFKKKKAYVLLSLLIQIQLVLIFLTAPAMFFMYYFCFYLCAYAWVGLLIVDM